MAGSPFLVLLTALLVCLLHGPCDAAGREFRLPKILTEFHSVFRNYQCQRVTVPLCTRFGYNHTVMPNYLNHQTQTEAASALKNSYCKLIEAQCSAELPFLLCAYHLPICVSNLEHPVVPCRSLCRRVKRACRPGLERANFSWPASLDCDALPRRDVKNAKGGLIAACADRATDLEPEAPFCPVRPQPAVLPQCVTPKTCTLGKPKKKFFCKSRYGWAAQGYVAEEITSNGQHAIRFRAKKLLFTGDSDLLRENMFEKDTSGYFDLTLHTGQYSHCDKCVKIKVSQKEVIVAGALSSSDGQPHLLFEPPAAIYGASKPALLKKTPKHIKKCLKKLAAKAG